MHNIKDVITLLCKYLNYIVGSNLVSEHFRLAKYNKTSPEIISAFWTTLDRLTFLSLEGLNCNIFYNEFDSCTRTKLRLAFLQYPNMDIYSCSATTNNCNSRALLIAVGWLLTKENKLNGIVRSKLINGSLGSEFSKVDIDDSEKLNDANLLTLDNQIHNLMHDTNKLCNNFKAIYELYTQKVRLMTKIHAASITTSGLPHLSVSEMSIIKTIATKVKDNLSEIEKLKEMEKHASMLDAEMKWTKKNQIFYTWMSTVIDEDEKAGETVTNETISELVRFIYILRDTVKKKLKTLKNKNECSKFISQDCPSRYLRIQNSQESSAYLSEVRMNLATKNDILKNRRAQLDVEIKSIFSLIPACVQVSEKNTHCMRM